MGQVSHIKVISEKPEHPREARAPEESRSPEEFRSPEESPSTRRKPEHPRGVVCHFPLKQTEETKSNDSTGQK